MQVALPVEDIVAAVELGCNVPGFVVASEARGVLGLSGEVRGDGLGGGSADGRLVLIVGVVGGGGSGVQTPLGLEGLVDLLGRGELQVASLFALRHLYYNINNEPICY